MMLVGRRGAMKAGGPNEGHLQGPRLMARSSPALVLGGPLHASHCMHRRRRQHLPATAAAVGPNAALPWLTACSRAPFVLSGQARRQLQTSAAVAEPMHTAQDTYKYRSLTKQGNMMSSVVYNKGNQGAYVEVVLDGYEPADGAPAVTPQLHWGLYRASGSQWYHPKESVPSGSTLDAGTGGMRSPMRWDARLGWVAGLNIPANLLPLQLALVFFFPDDGLYETPLHGAHFTIPVGMSAGEGHTLGASIVSITPPGADPQDATCNINFAMVSRHASAVYLSLVRVNPGNPNMQGTGVLEISLDPVTNRTGDVWHVCLHGLRNIGLLCWGWRADGDITWESGGRFHPGFLLCDPYATRAVPVLLPPAALSGAPKLVPSFDPQMPVMLGSLACFTQSFQWGGAHRPVARDGQQVHYSLEEQVLLELDIDKWTQAPEAERSVPPERRGKFLGVLDRTKEIVESGATTVLLGPCCWTAPGLGPWGRNPVALMSPNPQYAMNGPLSAAEELKAVIQVLHRAGLEVLMSVEYCLTAEGAHLNNGGLQGMRGLDAQLYYRQLEDSESSVLAAGHPVVRPLVVESLRHWAAEYALDGFCFVHAENLAQDQFGSILDNPPLAEEICHDPVLRGLKLIAAPGSIGLLPRAGVRGFPHWGIWQQTNERYQAALWTYLVNNTPGLLSDMATRITGSADLFGPVWDAGLPGALAAGRRAAFSINCVTPLGDVPLLQAVGGDEDLERAEVLARTLLLAQFTSSGTPIVAAETLNRKGLWRYVSQLAALRRQLRSLINPPITFAPPAAADAFSLVPPKRLLTWHAATPGMEVDWSNVSQGAYPSNVLAFSVRDTTAGSALYCALNPYDQPVQVAPPALPMGGGWRLVVDTCKMPPEDINMQGPLLRSGMPTYEVAPKAGILLVAVQAAAPAAGGPYRPTM